MRILVIEDGEVAARVLSLQLAKIGFPDVEVAGSAEEALGILDRAPFELLFVDWGLPGMNGPDFVRLVRAQPEQQAVGIIMITSRHQIEDVAESVKAGVDTYIVKPARSETLFVKIAEALAARQRRLGA